jgi:hypothetical protein
MKRAAAAETTAPSGWLRGLWPDHNPLRRTCDRAEAAIVAGLIAAFLIAAPVTGLIAGQWAYTASLHAEHAQRAAHHRVTAVLLASAPAAVPTGDRKQAWPRVPARWAAPGGAPRTGAVAAPPGTRAGHTVLVWTGTAGQLTGPPLRHQPAASQAALGAVLTVAGLGLVLGCGGVLSHRALDKRRLAAWDAGWQTTGPQWTSRH